VIRSIPGKYSIKWVLVILIYTILISFAFFVGALFDGKGSISPDVTFKVLLFSFILALIQCAPGFFGLKGILFFGALGYFVGLFFIFYAGFFKFKLLVDDHAGLYCFIAFAIAGVTLGIIYQFFQEIIKLIYRAFKKKSYWN
jgi:hypothetical protein